MMHTLHVMTCAVQKAKFCTVGHAGDCHAGSTLSDTLTDYSVACQMGILPAEVFQVCVSLVDQKNDL